MHSPKIERQKIKKERSLGISRYREHLLSPHTWVDALKYML
jgi:hypothetical protein